jgi:hypothetical protein
LLQQRLRDHRNTRHGAGAARRGCRRGVNKACERPHIVDLIKSDEISLIVNTTEGKRIRDSFAIRREAAIAR